MWSRNKLTLEAQALTGTSLACPIGFVLGAAIGATSSVWRASSVFVIGFYQLLGLSFLLDSKSENDICISGEIAINIICTPFFKNPIKDMHAFHSNVELLKEGDGFEEMFNGVEPGWVWSPISSVPNFCQEIAGLCLTGICGVFGYIAYVPEELAKAIPDIKPFSSKDEVKKAYRQWHLQNHPDKIQQKLDALVPKEANETKEAWEKRKVAKLTEAAELYMALKPIVEKYMS